MVDTYQVDFRGISALTGIALVVIYAVGSGIWVNASPGWYASLVRPPWQPPDFVFGLIWPYNFVVLGLAALRVSQKLSKPLIATWLISFAISIIFALLWAYQFYVPHNLKFSAICLAITSVLTIPLLVIAYKVSWQIGALLTPYQIWVITATTLAWGYAVRN